MCGIVGLIGCGNEDTLRKMAASVAHRGPDDEGVVWFRHLGAGIAHRRLSIIDLTPSGHQPMSNDTGDLWIVYNGEVYNYEPVRAELESHGFRFHSASDTEVVLKAFEMWGEKSLEKLNGMFAFALYNSRTKELFAARDRLGVKPFYYSLSNGGFVFASEVKAILNSGLIPKQVDYDALITPTRYQISPQTGFKGIFKLPPGHSLWYRQKQLSISPYWQLTPSEDPSITLKEAEENLDSLLKDAVRLQMVSDVPVGLLLSGGLDSSLIAALMRRAHAGTIRSFTIKFRESDHRFERNADDSIYAKEVAKTFDLEHEEIVIEPDIETLLPKLVWHLDEPLADPAAINTYLISEAARRGGIVVLLNGMGGDEIFAGYRKHLACMAAEKYQQYLPLWAQHGLRRTIKHLPVATATRGFRTARWAKRFVTFASLPATQRFLTSDLSLSRDQFRNIFREHPIYEETQFFQMRARRLERHGLSYLTRMCYDDTLTFLPEHNLTYSDKASMAVGVESRPPLTDHRIAEFMFTLPPKFRVQQGIQKYLLKKVANHYLSRKIIYRPKASFGSPLRSWIRGPLSGMVSDLLSEQNVQRRGLYNHKAVAELIENDRKGLEDNAHLIWQFLTTELWFRTFFES